MQYDSHGLLFANNSQNYSCCFLDMQKSQLKEINKGDFAHLISAIADIPQFGIRKLFKKLVI